MARSAGREREPDPYEVLQVSQNASAEVIQAAYRALARGYHPDVNGGGDESRRMRAINAAYATLSDPTRRTAYDARLRALRTRELRQMQTRQRPAPTTALLPREIAGPQAVIGAPVRGAQTVSTRRLLLALTIVVSVVLAMTVLAFWAVAAVLDDDPPMSPSFEQLRDIGQLPDVPAQPFLNSR